MTPRLFEESDLESCARLFVETFAQAPWCEEWDPGVVRARLRQIVQTPHFFGAVIDDGGVRGFALGFSEPWHEGSHFYLKEMCVAHALQRKGLGTRLMEFLSSELRAGGTGRMYLLTARGEASEVFYAKCGFYTSPKMILMARRFEKSSGVPHSAREIPKSTS